MESQFCNWEKCFDRDFILDEFKVLGQPIDYFNLIKERRHIKSETYKFYHNKNNTKLKFAEVGFNIPKTLSYTTTPITNFDIDTEFVIKPAHMSDSEFVYKNIFDTSINNVLHNTPTRVYPSSMRETEKGIIVEEFIDVKYELKVFVIWGCPLVCDIRTGYNELSRVGFIGESGGLVEWKHEYELIKKLALELKIDFFRVDFLYDGNKLYANECAFVPDTVLPQNIMDLIINKYNGT
jgi:hypothetical protein